MFRNIKIIYRKELVDVIRDRRTIISMIVVPILIFPLLTIGFSGVMANLMQKSAAEKHKIAVINKDDAPDLYALIDSSSKVEIVSTDISVDSAKQAILDKLIRAAIIIPDDFSKKLANGETTSVQLLYDASETKSDFALEKVKDLVTGYKLGILNSLLADRGVDPSLLEPFSVAETNVASKEKMGGLILSIFLPYIIILLSMLGAMYTAIDLTAGEKERGTLETILVSPVPRWQLATGKFLTILTTSVVSTSLAIISMSATMLYGMQSFGRMGEDMAINITPLMILIILLMMIPTACLFSALLMSIAIFAKSYKEAQSYLSPLMTIVILPALVAFLPGVELDLKLAFIPIVNICLCIKESLMGHINWIYVAIIFITTFIYASFAIFVTHRMFQKESVLFRS
jgi:sodium transport system permease protein